MLMMTINDYVEQVIGSLGRIEKELAIKMEMEAEKDETDENPDSAR